MSVPPGEGTNPLLDGLRIEPIPEPAALVIFGASGDLTRRKLLPALYRLARGQRLPTRFAVIGVARSAMTDEEFRTQFHASLAEFAALAKPDGVSSALAGRMTYIQGEMNDPALYRRIAERLEAFGAPAGVLYYLAIPPTVYGTVVEQLGAAGLTRGGGDGAWRRI